MLSLKLTQKIMLAFFVTLAFQLFFVGYLWFHLQAAQDIVVADDTRVRSIISHLTKLSTVMQNTSMRAMMQIVRGQQWMGDYHLTLTQITEELNEIRNLAKGDSEQIPIATLRATTDRAPGLLETAITEYNHDPFKHKKALMDLAIVSTNAGNQVDGIIDQYRLLEESQLQKRAESREQMENALLVGVVFNVIGGIFIFAWLSRYITYRLRILTDNSMRFAAGKALNPELPGNDEVTMVDRSFHQMAESMEESKRRETAVIENAMDVICSIDADGRFVEVSPACLSVWGYNPDELIGKRYVEIIDKSGNKSNGSQVPDITKERSQSSYENRVTRKDGRVVDMLWSARWSNREKTWFCVAHDITDRKKAEQLRRDFVAMISHDLRTPLTSVELSLNLLSCGACGDMSQKAATNVSDAERNLSYVMTLINGLLDLEKMNAGKLEMRFAPTTTQDVISRSVEAVKPLTERDNIKLAVESQDIDLVADENRLVQVVVNLLSNGLKFSPKDTEIKVAVQDMDNLIQIAVTDQGPGIASDQQSKIFERFERVEKTSKQVEGAGLGLAICKAIIEQHGGTIGVSSKESQGSTFYFRIPKQPVPAGRGDAVHRP